MTTKIKLPPINPNAGVSKRLKSGINSINRYILIQHVDNLLNNASVYKSMIDDTSYRRAMIGRLTSRLNEYLAQASRDVARKAVLDQVKAFDAIFGRQLKTKANLEIDMMLTPSLMDYIASIVEVNMSEIRTLAGRQIDEAARIVYQGILDGYDAGKIATDLRKSYNISRKKAEHLVRRQTAITKAHIEDYRRQEIGITHAVWLHSHAGIKPRPSHVAADGKEYEIGKGMYLDGKWTLPGKEPNCRCNSYAIINLDIK